MQSTIKTTIGELISGLDRELTRAGIKKGRKRQILLAVLVSDILNNQALVR